MVLDDDSVETVELLCEVGNGLLKAASSEGDMPSGASSLIGETRRAPRLAGLDGERFPSLARC